LGIIFNSLRKEVYMKGKCLGGLFHRVGWLCCEIGGVIFLEFLKKGEKLIVDRVLN